MKKIVVIYEGVADAPLDDLDGRTPLQAARASSAGRLAENGRGGMLSGCPEGFEDRNEVVLALLLGIPASDARRLFRGPLEALSAGMEAGRDHMVYRANFVTMDGNTLCRGAIPPLSLEETRILTASLQEVCDPSEILLEVLGPTRVLVRVKVESGNNPSGISPFRAEGADLNDVLPIHRKSDLLRDFIEGANKVLEGHPVNEVRIDLGENPANGIWLWGGGRVPDPGSVNVEGLQGGCMLTSNAMARGLAGLAGMNTVELVNPWNAVDKKPPDFAVARLMERLSDTDLLVVYAESPMEGGRYGSATDKVWALEKLDRYVLAPLMTVLESQRPFRLVLTTDSFTPTESGIAVQAPLPMVMFGEGIVADDVSHWDEEECKAGSLGIMPLERIMPVL